MSDFIKSNYILEIQQTDQANLPLEDKYIHLKQLLERSCKEITTSESLQFPSLFSRLVFISQKYELPKTLEWQLQNIRTTSTRIQTHPELSISPLQYNKAKEAIESFFSYIEGGQVNFSFVEDTLLYEEEPENIQSDRIRIQVLSIDKERELITGQSETNSQHLLIRYNTSINNTFNATINRLWIGAQLNIIEAKMDDNGYYIPKYFVLEPDYLIDASSIAECFQQYGNSHLHYFLRKIEPNANSHYILLGNLANFFLDELIYATDVESLTFKEAFLKSFSLLPFEYAACKEIKNNMDFKDFMSRAETQFNNIKRVVVNDMPHNGFDPSACTLEPSFFCEKYGFQGRLDLLQLSDDEKGVDRIIELKSGKPPYPREDATKIAPNHETQTVVYRLMTQSVFGKDARNIYSSILYSSVENSGENLRFSAMYQQLEKDILNIRNLIVATEHDLYCGDIESIEAIFKELFDIDNYGRVPQFFVNKLAELEKVLASSSQLERAYFFRYIAFVARELYLQKAGDDGYNSAMSISALWNTTVAERKESLDVISDLEIENIDDSGRDMLISFRRTDSSDCVNFREGEICILYPHQNNEQTVLSNQILKGTIVRLSSKSLLLRFRYKQRNQTFFSRYKYWAVEHDKLDHSYNAMYKGLYAFLATPTDKKKLLLGLRPPQSSYENEAKEAYSKEHKQDIVINKALAAQDYFLIVGPPGTGKTSRFARRLIEHLYDNTDSNMLVIAYTNRAVDELCSAICEALKQDEQACNAYIRIGSELSCGEPYRHRLLQHISHQANSRKELLQQIDNTRIFVGTLASITGKPELFDIKKFQTAIIDEASQILEPQIIGLLPRFEKFIMIGDHKQLSTITLQDNHHSEVKDELLNDIELQDCRESLFERLFRICQKNEWNTAYDMLTYHGRMHRDIAALVNKPFYNNMLLTATQRQEQSLPQRTFDHNDKYQALIANKRIAFVSCRQADISGISDKTNIHEANTIAAMAKALIEVYAKNGITFDPQKTLGIITPYRNQIALIKQKLEETKIPELSAIMIDTVERFQGSQRDVIFVSFCFNKHYQLRFFSNMDREGIVDRKLNVALTRAREQLFLVGNDLLLSQNPIYRKILSSAEIIF